MQTEEYINDLVTVLQRNEDKVASIIIGDLNTLPFQKGIRKIEKAGYINASSQLPQGTFGFFPSLPKLLKLDYIFCKGNVTPSYTARFSLSSSDHSGWVTDFELDSSND